MFLYLLTVFSYDTDSIMVREDTHKPLVALETNAAMKQMTVHELTGAMRQQGPSRLTDRNVPVPLLA